MQCAGSSRLFRRVLSSRGAATTHSTTTSHIFSTAVVVPVRCIIASSSSSSLTSSTSSSSWAVEDDMSAPPPPPPLQTPPPPQQQHMQYDLASTAATPSQQQQQQHEQQEEPSTVVRSSFDPQQQRRPGTFTVSEMEDNLKRQLGPQAQLHVREQRARRSPHRQQRNKEQEEARRLDADDDDEGPQAAASSSEQKQQQQRDNTNNNRDGSSSSSSSSLFRSSVTFRQNGFNITLWTAESTVSAEHAMRLAYNGAVATGIRFFNPSLRPKEAGVFDRVRFLALGMGKMIRFSVGGGGDDRMQASTLLREREEAARLLKQKEEQEEEEEEGGRRGEKDVTAASTTKQSNNTRMLSEQQQQQQSQHHLDEGVMDEEEENAPVFTCTAYIKDDWKITAGRSGDDIFVTTVARSAQEAFSNAVAEVRDKLTVETEEGEHALEDVRELQLALNNRSGGGFDTLDSALLFNCCSSAKDGSSSTASKLVHPELSTSYIHQRNKRGPGGRDVKNYTAKITVTDSFGNSYVVKSGEVNRTALLAYRNCVNQILKREAFLTQNPTKAFFTAVQWEVEHLTWYSGLARSLDWDFHYRATARNPNFHHQNKHQQQQQQVDASKNNNVYYHGTLHIGPQELASADGASGRYRVMLNTYCNALERLLSNCPRHIARHMPIPSIEALYSAYAEVDRYQPTDALKNAAKGLNPQTVLGAVTNLHLGHYFQMGIERRQSQRYYMQQQQQQQQSDGGGGGGGGNKNYNRSSEQQQQQHDSRNSSSGGAEDIAVCTVPLPSLEGSILIGEASSVKAGSKGQPIVLGRSHASKYAATYALRDNWPLIFNQVKDRVDYKYGTDREHEKRKQHLRAIPREKQISKFSTLQSMMREFGQQDYGWADVDVDCIVRNSGLWIGTCFARMESDGSTKDLRTSRPAMTKSDCRRQILVETAYKLWPDETKAYFSKNNSVHEFPGLDIAAVFASIDGSASKSASGGGAGGDASSGLLSLSSSGGVNKPFDPVSSGSLTDQLLTILEERTAPRTLLKVSAELITENPFPVSSAALRHNNDVRGTSAAESGGEKEEEQQQQSKDTSNKTTTSSTSQSSVTSFTEATDPLQHQKLARYRVSVLSTDAEPRVYSELTTPRGGGVPLFPLIKDCITNCAEKKLQLSSDRIRLLLTSFEDHHPQGLTREQDFAEWLLRAHVGFDNVKVKTAYQTDQKCWVAALSVKMPVFECLWPQDVSFASNTRSIDHHGLMDPAASSTSSASSMVATTTATSGGSGSGGTMSTSTTTTSAPRVYEDVELARVFAPTKRLAVKFALVRAVATNCYAHLNYLSQKSVEMQGDADALLGLDTDQFDTLVTSEQSAAFHRLMPSPISVLRAVLKTEHRALRVVVGQAIPEKISSSSSLSSGAGGGGGSDLLQNPPQRVNMFGDTTAAAGAAGIGGDSSGGMMMMNNDEPLVYDCVLYAVPVDSHNNNNNSGGDGDENEKGKSTVVLAQASFPEDAQQALDTAVRKALDDLMGDEDLHFWNKAWELQLEDVETVAECANPWTA